MVKLPIFLHFLCLAVTIPTLYANILETDAFWQDHLKEFDQYWRERAKIAEKDNQAAYFADPYAVSGNFTSSISE